jgi:hypothetical protein
MGNERLAFAKFKADLSLKYPVNIVSTYCNVSTRSVVQKTPHGIIRWQVQFSNIELSQHPVLVYSPEHGVTFKGTTNGEKKYNNDDGTFKKDNPFLQVLIVDVIDWLSGPDAGENAKRFIGQKLLFPHRKVKEII